MERRDGNSLLHPGQIANENRRSFGFLKEWLWKTRVSRGLLRARWVVGKENDMKKEAGPGGSSRRLDPGIIPMKRDYRPVPFPH
jgi:hypothetical protein